MTDNRTDRCPVCRNRLEPMPELFDGVTTGRIVWTHPRVRCVAPSLRLLYEDDRPAKKRKRPTKKRRATLRRCMQKAQMEGVRQHWLRKAEARERGRAA